MTFLLPHNKSATKTVVGTHMSDKSMPFGRYVILVFIVPIFMFLFAQPASANGFPRVRIEYKLPKNSALTEIIERTYALDPAAVERNLKGILSKKFPNGISVADAELFGFVCDKTENADCSYHGKVVDQIIGVDASRLESQKREVSIGIYLKHPIKIQNLVYEVEVKYIGQ